MRRSRNTQLRTLLLAGCAGLALAPAMAFGQTEPRAAYNIPAQDLGAALTQFGQQAEREIVFSADLTRNRRARPVSGEMTSNEALGALLAGTGLTYRISGGGSIVVEADQGPQGGSAGGDVEALIVTAQKREENIQDVPIAISAFSQEDLTRSQVAGGPDLMTQVPNMTFTKTNFSSYSIQIRGIGTQAISATTDAAVAVALNNTPFIRNRFFEQEFYDLQRVEVLRGPQGTLYGRNATAGVVNIISAKPKFYYEAKAAADVSNFQSTRLEGMVNLPLVDDAAAVRIAGAWTKREGYDTNQLTGNQIDGRDLWSTRVSLRLAPTDGIEANLIWEHFQEDDDRLRSGKQLCKTHEVTDLSGHFPDGTAFSFPTTHDQKLHDNGNGGGASSLFTGVQATLSQGCEPSSLYSPDSFQTPNGLSLPYYVPLQQIGLRVPLADPYVSRFQSQDLRVIESTVDPEYRAKSDLAEFQFSIDVAPGLTLTSETAYSTDTLFSKQDFNRFNTASGAWLKVHDRPGVLTPGPNGEGVFCDPQIGCADRLVAIDISSAKSRQFSQEFRLSSDYDGPFNFSLGANFLRYDTEDKYYVFINSLTLLAAAVPTFNPYYADGEFREWVPGKSDSRECLRNGPILPDPSVIQGVLGCIYIDPNPIGSLNDEGHNYFLSRNPYKLISYAAFGEAYYNLTDNLKVTAGLRWTVDKKEAPTIPSWVLAAYSLGYPITGVVEQEWREPTGRLTIDWKPNLSFTDETLLYFSYAHGYKAGGANPPPAGPTTYAGFSSVDGPSGPITLEEAALAESATHPRTFDPEFVNAFEVGAKNTLLDGKLTLNVDAFYYDYTGYQISEIVDRSALNLNFDADVWGLEIEADWRPLENLRLGFKGGYENTRVADGEKAVDLMNRTAGHDDWIVVRPFPTFTSNCILPAWLYVGYGFHGQVLEPVQVGAPSGGNPAGCELAYLFGVDPITQLPYKADPTIDASGLLGDHPNYPGFDPSTAPNNGEGFDTDLSGNDLPNAPHFTATLTADYTVPLPNDWLATFHTDIYYQSEAWTRIFNLEGYDKLKAYSNINFAAIFANEDAGWRVMAYVKNVLDHDSITGAFLNSDDTGLTTNVFLTEPRLYGIRVSKNFTGDAWWSNSNHPAGEPYRLTVELGGQAQRHDAPYDSVTPAPFNVFSPQLQGAVLGAEHRDLDWGDGREVKLTYAATRDWRVSLAARTGETNGGGHKFLTTEYGGSGCWFGAGCNAFNFVERVNYADGVVSDHEEHTLVDFALGRDVGMGMPGIKSSLSAGLRYADFKSGTRLDMQAIPDWQVPSTFAWYGHSQHHTYQTDITAHRDFEGLGPTLTWEASKELVGNDEAGHMNLDWSVEGGVLFGKQNSFATGEERALYFDGYAYFNYDILKQSGPTVVTPPDFTSRSKSVTVPMFAATLGLSYEIQRVKISGGYRWERYFDVLDAGWAAPKDADRTIDGPYFKLAIGFGG